MVEYPIAGTPLGEDAQAPGLSMDDDVCWVCGAPVKKRHCKVVCERCGFLRDCSDP
jgi:hypothetical protein